MIKHIDVNMEGKIKKSKYSDGVNEFIMDINCFETYSNTNKNKSINEIANLLENYRKNKELNAISTYETFTNLQHEFIANFISDFDYFVDGHNFIYFFSSHDNFINRVLSILKEAIIIKFTENQIHFTDISDCFHKINNIGSSKGYDFSEVINNYELKPDTLNDSIKEAAKETIETLVIIDDVIADGKALNALIHNLVTQKAIDFNTKIKFNSIYCTNRSYKNDYLDKILKNPLL